MPTPQKKGRKTREERATGRMKSPGAILAKEYNYVLQLTEEDTALLARYQNVLAQGAAGFAETTYNYLFDNPDIADVMYAYERQGGDIGKLVRAQMAHMLNLLHGDIGQKSASGSEHVGRAHHRWGVKPVWSLGTYRLFLEHVQHLVANDPQIEADDRDKLESALIKMVFRDIGMTSEAYWRETVEQLTRQRDEMGIENGLAGQLLGSIPQLLWSVDIESNQVSYASPATRVFCADQLEAPIPCFCNIHGAERERVLTAWQQVIDGETVELEVRVTRENKGERWYRMAFYPTANRRGRVLRVHCMMEDISDLHKDRERLEQLSTKDQITGLANRTLWYDRLTSALAVARRNPGASVGVMMLDINQFRMYNDSLGQEAGDELLRQMAERLQKVVRDTDTLARLGGDEFGIVLPMLQDAGTAAECVANKVIDSIAEPFSFEGKELCLSSAIGIAVYPQHGENAHSLASHADSAMYRAKWNSEPYLFYEPESTSSAAEHLQFSGQLHGALDRQEFELHYQPMIDLASGRICGVEALLRWQHPQLGLVYPAQFIPLAEQLGMITSITDWVLAKALAQSKEWPVSEQGVPTSINISTRSFQSADLVERIARALEEADVEGSALEIEITEKTLMTNLDKATDVLKKLSQMGVGIAIDDFGTGYSSLVSLQHLPINTLKIDQSFLENMASSTKDAVIVRAIIELGHNLGYKVVAEGVEDTSVHDQLQTLGCDRLQGFHISRPLPDSGFRDWLAETAH